MKFNNIWDEERSEYKCKSKKCGCCFIPAKESPYDKMMSKEEKKHLYKVSPDAYKPIQEINVRRKDYKKKKLMKKLKNDISL